MKRNTLFSAAVLFILAYVCLGGLGQLGISQAGCGEGCWLPPRRASWWPMLPAKRSQFVSPLKGKPAPAFALEDLSGKKVSLASYKGKAVLMNFWATWCGPCKIETPWLVELRDKYAAQGFEILGVETEADDLTEDDTAGWAKDKADVATSSCQRRHMEYPVLIEWRQHQQALRRPRRSAHIVFRRSQRQSGCGASGTDFESDIEANIKKALGE